MPGDVIRGVQCLLNEWSIEKPFTGKCNLVNFERREKDLEARDTLIENEYELESNNKSNTAINHIPLGSHVDMS